jgi:hypothetical protein
VRIHETHTRSRKWLLAVGLSAAAMAVSAPSAMAEDGGVSPDGGGGATNNTGKVQVRDGLGVPPSNAPQRVKDVVYAANRIAKGKGYCYGGGHSSFRDNCYDCSGAVSYALHGGNFVSRPRPSSGYFSWGKRGKGDWITVYTRSSHMYVEIKGARFDTSNTPGAGPGWSENLGPHSGFKKRHPKGY